MAQKNVTVDYEDPRFADVEADKEQALTELENTYGGIIGESDKYYQAQIDASKQWADTQSQLQQERTDFTIEQIEQQKDQAQKDYLEEQSGAYTDWQKQSNQYGVKAEQMAAAGLAGTGFSESSQVGMYNAYQNRVATARESFNNAVINYNNAIKDARLQNNSVLAEIAYQSLQTQLELSLQGFQYKNNLVLELADKKTQADQMYYQRYQDVVNQINTENQMAEQIRQFEETQKFEAEQARLDREFQAKQAELERTFKAQQAVLDRNFEKSQAELNRKHDLALQAAKTKAEKELIDKQHKNDMAKLAQQHKNDKAILDKQLANEKALLKAQNSGGGGGSAQITGGGGGGGNNSQITGGNNGGGKTVKTDYYNGALPSATTKDGKTYGTFDNGYQPKGIAGHGKVTKTGDVIYNTTKTLNGQSRQVKQNVWKTPDGTLWYWEGREMKYKKISAPKKNSGKKVTTTSSSPVTKSKTAPNAKANADAAFKNLTGYNRYEY